MEVQVKPPNRHINETARNARKNTSVDRSVDRRAPGQSTGRSTDRLNKQDPRVLLLWVSECLPIGRPSGRPPGRPPGRPTCRYSDTQKSQHVESKNTKPRKHEHRKQGETRVVGPGLRKCVVPNTKTKNTNHEIKTRITKSKHDFA